MLTALDKTWHPDHFCCGSCNKPIDEPSFHTNDGKPYCTPCYSKIFAKVCNACEKPIMDVSIFNDIRRTNCRHNFYI